MASPDISGLRKQRGGFKSQLTLFSKRLNNTDIDNMSSNDIETLKSRLARLERTMDDFESVQNQIDFLVDEGDVTEMEEREKFEDTFDNLRSTAISILERFNSQFSPQPEQNVSNLIKLPRIELPTFDGEFAKWHEFKDAFSSIIHVNNQIADVQKLQYLRSSIKGEPAELIRGLETTNANYLIAWDALIQRYDNKRKIVFIHIKNILDAPNISKDNSRSLGRLISIIKTNTDCLKSCGIAVDAWDAILIAIIVSKLDFGTNKEWQTKLNETSSDTIPSLEELLNFLSAKVNTLESLNPHNDVKQRVKSFTVATSITNKCVFCRDSHRVFDCNTFKGFEVGERIKRAREAKLCLNCLKRGHFSTNCESKSRCRQCNKKHNSLLHLMHNTNESNDDSTANSIACSATNNINSAQTLLPIAKAKGTGPQGQIKSVRILLDSGSQSNFITEEASAQLGLERIRCDFAITGIGGATSGVTHKCKINLKSFSSNFNITLDCIIIPKITGTIPQMSINRPIKIPSNITLVNADIFEKGPIDILIGAAHFWDLLNNERIKTNEGVTFCNSKFGWVASGTIPIFKKGRENALSCVARTCQLHASVERFWRADEFVENRKTFTSEETFCEEFYKETTVRDPSGRFIVRIPTVPNAKDIIGNTRDIAIKRFLTLERKLHGNTSLLNAYKAFMAEYIQMGHMAKALSTEGFYLAHHGVLNEGKETTKLRVVFDGSCRPERGLSINDTQYNGPVIQNDLFSILSRFRKHKFALTGDISKMYRQVIIHPDDRDFQKIVWRENPNDDLEDYTLNTVTYGTKAAPFLAIRSLYQLGIDASLDYPLESRIIREDFYVDDVLTGANSTDELFTIKENLIKILDAGGFPLTKFKSNVKELGDQSSGDMIYKTLGLTWRQSTDEFICTTIKLGNKGSVTKRKILAGVATLFDPLGFIAPIIVSAKLILQELWKLQIDWDEPVPTALADKWKRFVCSLNDLSELSVPRRIIEIGCKYELHTFCDASEAAYGACIYIRSLKNGVTKSIRLLASKTRVAPLNKVLTIPKLELNAAVLAVDLASKFKRALQIQFHSEYFWCDSMVTLGWIKGDVNKWKIYVANRVNHIQQFSNLKNWHHVRSENNPADLLTRGIIPEILANNSMWWDGPSWLPHFSNKELTQETIECTEELRNNTHGAVSLAIVTNEPLSVFTRYSSFKKLTRVIANIFRFVNNCRVTKSQRSNTPLSVSELENARNTILRKTQEFAFGEIIQNLRKNELISRNNKLISYAPFLDSNGLLRVGGRLIESNLAYDAKHPIILPNNNHVTNIIIRDTHIKEFHAGPKLLITILRENYHVLKMTNSVKRVVRDCLICRKQRAQTLTPMMGNLPRERVTPMPPFFNTGVDYAGPFYIKDRRGRGSKVSKAYIALFVCFSTKALHLELVSDMTTDCFLACFKRFISRRGTPSNLYSDNGTNFVGAQRELSELYNMIHTNKFKISDSLAEQKVNWHFIPPHSPNFGGLWEAGVKSVKQNLKRVISNTPLTFEEFCTVLSQIEASLNSRPLIPLSNDPNDLEVLTPAHFLIGRKFTSLWEPSLQDIPISRLGRYQHLQLLHQHFWTIWQKEYLHSLQQRTKWQQDVTAIKEGTLVIIKENNSPPNQWKMGRVVKLSPGRSDNITRVVTVKTKNGDVVRPVSKLIVLLSEAKTLI